MVVFFPTTKEKYHGTIQEGIEVVWMCQLFGEIGLPIHTSATIYCDKHSSTQAVDNHVSHSKMKHIDIHAHNLSQLVHENIVSLEYCKIDD
jgi:hypothetical protein